ncbi:S-layer homology domain-containing protein [Intestinibacillus massiliensis]|uniref:S-layer homology domain-containing protein n=1 Tax=Intestinibacillus massiliensis TaxID=1871029 RepID=UPI00117B07A6|nr:S-layer homology domain-containing protein [Intestinibacillus massiliensis]
MRKTWKGLAALIAAAMACTLLPLSAAAADSVRHTQIESIDLRRADKNDDRMASQGWTWNHDNKLLTLHGVDIDSAGKSGCILLPEDEDVTIQFIGRNKLHSGKSPAIALKGGSLTFLTRTAENESADASLSIVTNGSAISVTGGDIQISEGIFDLQTADVAIQALSDEEGNGGEISIRGGMLAAASDTVAVQADAALKVIGGSVTAVGSKAAMLGASLSIPGMTVTEGGAVVRTAGRNVYTFSAGEARWADGVLEGASQKVVLEQPSIDGGAEPQPEEKPAAAPKFADMEGHWAEDIVNEAVRKGLFSGTSATAFSPDAPITRGMAVTVLYRMQGSPAVYGARPPYTDTPADAYYAPAVIWAAENDVAQGVGNGIFAPEERVTREEFAAMVYNCRRACGYQGAAGGTLGAFSDSGKVSAWAQAAVTDLVGSGLLTGKEAGRLDPQGVTTRAEAAAMLMRLQELQAA